MNPSPTASLFQAFGCLLVIVLLLAMGTGALVSWIRPTIEFWCASAWSFAILAGLCVLWFVSSVFLRSRRIHHIYRRWEASFDDAARISKAPGTSTSLGAATVWHTGQIEDLPARFAATQERLQQLFLAVFDIELQPKRPLRVLFFDRIEALMEFIEPLGFSAPDSTTYYLQGQSETRFLLHNWSHPAVALLGPQEELLRKLCPYALEEIKGSFADGGWQFGLADALLAMDTPFERSRILRQNKGLLAMHAILPPEQLLLDDGQQYELLLSLDPDQRELWTRFYTIQMTGFWLYLLENKLPQAKAFIERVQPKSCRALVGLKGANDYKGFLSSLTEASFDETVVRWRDWIEDSRVIDVPTPAEKSEVMERFFLPQVLSSETSTGARIIALLFLAQSGIQYGANALVELLVQLQKSEEEAEKEGQEEGEKEARTGLLEALGLTLTLMSGKAYGGDATAWKKWSRSLPKRERSTQKPR